MFLVGSPVLEIYHYIIVRNSPVVKIAVIYSSMTAEEGRNFLLSLFIYVQSLPQNPESELNELRDKVRCFIKIC